MRKEGKEDPKVKLSILENDEVCAVFTVPLAQSIREWFLFEISRGTFRPSCGIVFPTKHHGKITIKNSTPIRETRKFHDVFAQDGEIVAELHETTSRSTSPVPFLPEIRGSGMPRSSSSSGLASPRGQWHHKRGEGIAESENTE